MSKKLHNKLNIDGEEYLIQASGAAHLDSDIELTIKSGTSEWGKTSFGSEKNPTAAVDISGGAATANPLMDGTATPGTENKFAREDHVHPTDTTRAPNNHADASDKYGLAETGKYGHAKSASAIPLTDSATTRDGRVGDKVAVFAREDHIHPRHEHPYAGSASDGGPANSVKATHTIAYTKATGDNNMPAANNFNKPYNGSSDLVVTIPNAVGGDTLTAGFITGKNQKKLDEIEDGAEVNQVAYSNVKVGTTDVAATTKTDTLTLVAGDNIDLTPSAADKKITISTPSYTADEGVELDGNYNFRAALKAYDDITKKSVSFKSTSTNDNRFYPVELDKNADLAVQVPWTDTSVTAVGNHYSPTAVASEAKSATASGGSTMGWNASVVTGVTLSRDAKGHVTGVSVNSAKIPTNPDTNTSHTHDAGIGLVGSGNDGISGGKYSYKAKLRSETALTIDSSAADTTSGRVYPIATDKSGYLAVNVPWTDTSVTAVGNHYKPVDNIPASKTASASGGSVMGWSSSVVTGVTLSRDAAGHVIDVAVTSAKIPANPDSNTAHAHSAGVGLSLSGSGDISGTTTYTLKTAATGEIGGIKVGSVKTNAVSTQSLTTGADRNYAIEVDSNGKAFVNVPWRAQLESDVFYIAGDGITMSTNTQGSESDPHTFSHATPTAVASAVTGSGIKTVNSVTFDGYGHVTGFSLRDMTKAATSTLGVTYLHGATDCTTYTSDDGGITPLALRKALTGSADNNATNQTFIATSSRTGVVKSTTTGTTANRTYYVEVESDGKMKVNVPWENTYVDTNTTYTISTGDNNGQIKVTPNPGTAYNVDVKGLGSAAYTNSTAYAAASHSHSDYASTSHNHDSVYAAKSHSHSSYASSSHSHSGYLRGSVSGSVLTITIVS